jgi:putative membrane protein
MKKIIGILSVLLLGAGMTDAIAQSADSHSAASTSAPSSASASSSSNAAAPNDAQIASIVVTANTVDIDAGKLAEKMGHNKEVKKFAQRMVTDHTGVNKQATALVKKLHVTPEDNPTSQSLKEGGDKNIAHLKTLKGDEFDKAYIDNEVTYHQAVLDAIDNTLIPNAKNQELKALIVKVRPAIDTHLQHAKQVQASLK